MKMWLIMAALLASVTAAGAGEKIQDRHPAMIPQAQPVRAPAPREGAPLTFEQRWAPVRELMVRDALVAMPPAPAAVQNAPAASAAPMEPRPVKTVMVTIRKPDQETCRRHGRRTVWNGNSWSCRR
jgi:hypothetical protein